MPFSFTTRDLVPCIGRGACNCMKVAYLLKQRTWQCEDDRRPVVNLMTIKPDLKPPCRGRA